MKKEKLILDVPNELWAGALQAATAWKLYHKTEQWDHYKQRLLYTIPGTNMNVVFVIHETKTGTISVNLAN